MRCSACVALMLLAICAAGDAELYGNIDIVISTDIPFGSTIPKLRSDLTSGISSLTGLGEDSITVDFEENATFNFSESQPGDAVFVEYTTNTMYSRRLATAVGLEIRSHFVPEVADNRFVMAIVEKKPKLHHLP